MSKGSLKNSSRVKQGDLVTYRAIKEIASHYRKQKIVSNGIGIVILVDDEFAKVYWIHAKSYLWILVDKLTTFKNLKDLKTTKH
jgi:hypothetical protein